MQPDEGNNRQRPLDPLQCRGVRKGEAGCVTAHLRTRRAGFPDTDWATTFVRPLPGNACPAEQLLAAHEVCMGLELRNCAFFCRCVLPNLLSACHPDRFNDLALASAGPCVVPAPPGSARDAHRGTCCRRSHPVWCTAAATGSQCTLQRNACKKPQARREAQAQGKCSHRPQNRKTFSCLSYSNSLHDILQSQIPI